MQLKHVSCIKPLPMKVISQKEMPLLARKRITFEIDHVESATPSRQAIKSKIAEHFSAKPELVSIRHIYPKFGQHTSKVIAHIYQDEKTLKFLETPKGKKAGAKPQAAK